jgi:glycosyltransferase involved in cell wall biosynthesis
MTPISVVIITKNEAETIARCIRAARLISNDIIIVDNDSTDSTTDIAQRLGCHVYREHWDGYGANKNKGIKYARHDWILSIDADEVADEQLIRTLRGLKLTDPEVVYDIPFITYYGNKPVHFGSWGRDHHARLFNRKATRWNEPPVHEKLMLPPAIKTQKLRGHLHHYSVKNDYECHSKIIHYARLSAEKYLMTGEKATVMKLYFSPAFHFVKNYILFLGFLDGREGWQIARMIAKHTRLKYRLLQRMTQNNYNELPRIKDKLAVEY